MLWLSGMDSNHDKSLQRALCYRYTTGHAGSERSHALLRVQRKFVASRNSGETI